MSVLTGSFSLYKQLSDLGVIYNKAATINWRDATIQQEWHISIPSSGKKFKFSNLFNNKVIKITNFLPNSLECIIFPDGTKDSESLDIISTTNDTLTIKVENLKTLTASEMLVIKFTSPLDRRLYGGMCEQYHNRTPIIKNSLFEISFSVILNRADLWKNDFKSITFNNIVKTFGIHLDELMIEQSLSEDLKNNLLRNTNLATMEQTDALQFFNRFNNTLLTLNGQNNHKLFSVIRLESSAGIVNLQNVRCEFNNYFIEEGIAIRLPTTLMVEVVCSINGNDQALYGRFIFNPEIFQTIISDLMASM